MFLWPQSHCSLEMLLMSSPNYELHNSQQPSFILWNTSLLEEYNLLVYDAGSPLSVNRRFGGTYCLYLQGRRNKFSKKWLALNGLHGVISQNMILFITTAVKTSDPTPLCLLLVWCSLLCKCMCCVVSNEDILLNYLLSSNMRMFREL
jgi:hypothetical protein